MEIAEFVRQIEQSKDFTPISMIIKEEIDGEIKKSDGVSHVVIKHNQTNMEVKVPVDAIRKTDWNVLCDVMSGKREPSVLQHMTRVVGYYSRVENWNQSKIGELKDRHKGDYMLRD